MHWYTDVFKNHYADFDGRATRQEYWMFCLFNAIISIIIILLMNATESLFFMVIAFIYDIAIIIPSLALTVRRLHDIGYSGWMVLLGLIPFAGGIILLVFACLDSQPNDNRFGPNPKRFVNNATQSQVAQPTQQPMQPQQTLESIQPTQPQTLENEIIYCSECGQKNTMSGSFCTRCGKELRKE